MSSFIFIAGLLMMFLSACAVEGNWVLSIILMAVGGVAAWVGSRLLEKGGKVSD